MKTYQALLIDVDGTLVTRNREIPPSVIKAIHQAKDSGLLIGLSTGRAHVSLTTIFNQIGWEGAHIVAGGAQVFDGNTKKVVWEKCIESDDVKWLHQEVESRGGGTVIVRDDALYTYDELVERFQHHPWRIPVKHHQELTSDWSSPLVSVHQINPELEKFLLNQDRLHAVKMKSLGGVDYFDVTAWGVTKREGLIEWSRYTGIDLINVVAVGDGLNDLELMSQVGCPVAMGNAVPELKRIAKMAVGSNEEGGLTELITWLIN